MTENYLDIIKGAYARNQRDSKFLKRKYVSMARSALDRLPEGETALSNDQRRMITKDAVFVNAVVALWFLGYWPDQIATFISGPITEAHVLGALRRFYVNEQENLLTQFNTTLETDNG
jgi:hypothetical protein